MRRNGRRAARISVFLSVVVWIVFLQGLALAQVVLRNQPVSSTLNHNNETTIAINPSDTLNLIGGTIVQGTNAGPLGYFWSIDGGVSWSANEQFSVGSEQLTDPVVAFDGHGVAYYVYLRKHDGIFLHKSTNGGQSWPGYRRPVLTTQMTVDKPWLAISPIMNQSNQHDISVVFIENDPLGLNGIHVWEGFSSDSGATFSNSRLTESSDFFGGPSVAFGPDNKRYFVWARLDNSTPSRTTHIWFMPSGGESTPITSVNQAGVVDQVSQRYVLKSSKVRVTSYPSIDVDRSEGSRRGWIYVTWTDGETPDVLLIKSTDGGVSWIGKNGQRIDQGGSPIRVNIVTSKDQWFPSVSVDSDGNVNVIFYESKNSSDNESAELCFARSVDGGDSFSHTFVGPAFTVLARNNDNFMGDYIQMGSWTGAAHAFWMRHDGNKYRAQYTKLAMPTTNVTVMNDLGGTSYGIFKIIHYPNTPLSYPSDTSFSWPNPSLRKIQAVDQYNNPFGDEKNWKFRDWNGNLADRINPRVFSIISGTPQIRAEFRRIHPITVQNKLIDIDGNTGTVQFKDPLGSNSYEDKTSPFSRGDIFENELESPYGIGAPGFTDANEVRWGFLSWSDGGNQQHNITITGPITYTATYKAHLATFSPTGTSSNNQRKIAKASNGTLLMVYESADRIWFTKSTNGGSTWSNEVEVSVGSQAALNRYPSLVSDGDIVNIVWQSTEPEAPPFVNCYIQIRSYQISTNTWQPTQLVGGGSFTPSSQDYVAQPVIDASALWPPNQSVDEEKRVAWRSPNGIAVASFYGGSWGGVMFVPGTHSNCYNPGIANHNGVTYSVVWEDRNAQKIMYSENQYDYFVNTSQVSPSGWSYNKLPSLSIAQGKPVVAWESKDNVIESGSTVHVRAKQGMGSAPWESYIASFSQGPQAELAPVIGTLTANQKRTVLYNYSQQLWKATYNGTSWSPADPIAGSSGTGVNISTKETSQLQAIWKKANNAIKVETSGITPSVTSPDDGLMRVASGASFSHSDNASEETSILRRRKMRHGIVEIRDLVGEEFSTDESPEGLIAFQIASLRVNSSEVAYATPDRGMRSQDFVLDGPAEFKGAIYGRGLGVPVKKLFEESGSMGRIVLRDTEDENRSVTLWEIPFSKLAEVNNGTMGEFRSLRLDGLGLQGRQVFLDIEMFGPSGRVSPIIVDDQFVSTAIPDTRPSELSGDNNVIPEGLALHQNYPNPFNPSTTIGFELPDVSDAKIEVFNSLGQMVWSSGTRTFGAGAHTVSVDLSGQPSGVYLYRLTAADRVLSRSLTLIK